MTGVILNAPAGTMEGVLYLLQAILLLCLLEDRRRWGLPAALGVPVSGLLLLCGVLVLGCQFSTPLLAYLAQFQGPSILLTAARLAAIAVVVSTAVTSRRSPETAIR